MLKKILKRLSFTVLSLVLLIVISYFLVVACSASFGGNVGEKRQQSYTKSQQFREGIFHNINDDVPQKRSFKEIVNLAIYFFTDDSPNKAPEKNIEVIQHDSTEIASFKATRLIWFGHSSFLLQTQGKNILLDPMFSQVAAPYDWLGRNRFNKEMPIKPVDLPTIDAVLFSHDHYDHLDYKTILEIKHKVKHFYVPLGLGVHLEEWGVPATQITELDWWQSAKLDNFEFTCTPSQHFSGRKLNNGQSTLWASWVLNTQKEKIYFSGDSGYANHFKQIGEKYGPFDLALLECGQYNMRWSDIHMLPEQTAQAGVDLKAKMIMPIHWGGFQLALHHWKDPIRRVEQKAKELDLKIITPRIGQEIILDSTQQYARWWEEYE